MSDIQTLIPYEASCHCGKVTYTVNIPSISENDVASCNCSMCARNGYLHVYPPREQVVFHSGFEDLVDYRFGTKTVSHKFCPTCGSSVMLDLQGFRDGIYGMNVRMFKDFDQNQPGIKLKHFDGKSLAISTYSVGDDTPASTDNLHQANCHCGAVKYSVSKYPLNAPESVMRACNCSICSKNGYIVIYPDQADVTFTQGKDLVREYRFASKQAPHYFCVTCGNSLYIDVSKVFPGKEALAINIRMFKDFDENAVHPQLDNNGKSR